MLITRYSIEQTHSVIAPFVRRTPTLAVEAGLFAETSVLLKLELLQHTGSFKPRGAFANLLTRSVPEAGVAAASGGNHGAAVARDYSLGIVAVIGNLGSPAVATGIVTLAALLLFTWLITSLDSATLVLCHLLESPDVRLQQALWGVALAAITCVLIAVGGVPALQAASILVGLPLAAVALGVGAGLLRDLVAGRL